MLISWSGHMNRILAQIFLIIASAIWGFSNVAEKTILDDLDPFFAVGLRCVVATIVILPFVWRSWNIGKLDVRSWLSLAVVSGLFAAALIMEQFAFLTSTVTNVSFLVNTTVVVTPIVAWLIFKETPAPIVAGAIVMMLNGAFLMSEPSLDAVNPGDMLGLSAAIIFAFWTIALGWYVNRFGNPVFVASAQFFVAAITATLIGMLTETITMTRIVGAVPELLILGLFSTALAFVIQAVAQRHVSASVAVVLVAGESVFGALGGFMFLDERLDISGFAGAILILFAILTIAISPVSTKTKSA
jgi:drug/metabolite transporter (DMT)-like permease